MRMQKLIANLSLSLHSIAFSDNKHCGLEKMVFWNSEYDRADMKKEEQGPLSVGVGLLLKCLRSLRRYCITC